MDDVLFPHIAHGFRGKELPIITYHVSIITDKSNNNILFKVEIIYFRIIYLKTPIFKFRFARFDSRKTMKILTHSFPIIL